MKIGFFNIGTQGVEYMKRQTERFKAINAEVAFYETVLNEDHILEDSTLDVVSVFVDSSVKAEALRSMPAVKLVATLSTGYDHIDLNYCKSKNISVTYVPTYGEHTVAEYTFALLLSLSRKICESSKKIGEVSSLGAESLRGFDLCAKTLGVVGTGKIGKNVIKIAKGFEMKIVAYDVIKDEAFAKTYGFEYVPLETLLRESDIVTLHVPYMKETHHLINSGNIALMKPSAFLVNTSRGAVIETEALFGALKEKKIKGVALDVLEDESTCFREDTSFLAEEKCTEDKLKTLLLNEMLIDMPNVLVTPHNAFNSYEALERIFETTVQNIESWAGGQPKNIVPELVSPKP